MAKIDAGIAINMATWNLGDPFNGHLGAHDSHHFTICDAGKFTWDVGGYGFLYFGGVPVWGIAKSLTITDENGGQVCISGTGISIPGFYAFAAFSDLNGLESYLFRDNDRMLGSDFDDVLKGFGGRDRMFGHMGDDRMEGGSGADVLRGGSGFDTYVYNAASESTGKTFDRVGDFRVHQDNFVLPTAVTAIDATIATGALRGGHFDDDLAAAADAAHLGAGHAVLFTPDDGQHAGDTFMVVDMNGTAGYQAGEDLVVQFVGGSVPSAISVANFEVG